MPHSIVSFTVKPFAGEGSTGHGAAILAAVVKGGCIDLDFGHPCRGGTYKGPRGHCKSDGIRQGESASAISRAFFMGRSV